MSSTKYYHARFEKFIYILLVENEAVLQPKMFPEWVWNVYSF